MPSSERSRQIVTETEAANAVEIRADMQIPAEARILGSKAMGYVVTRGGEMDMTIECVMACLASCASFASGANGREATAAFLRSLADDMEDMRDAA